MTEGNTPKRLGSRDGLGGDVGATSQAQANLTCPFLNYVQGLYLNTNQVTSVGGTVLNGGGDPTKNTIKTDTLLPPQETTLVPSPNVSLS